VKQVIKEGKLKKEDITKILLVGGSTYIPRILNTLSDDLNFEVHREVDPTYCVAMGAAIQGGIIAGEEIDTILIDVNSHSLGIRCLNIKPTGKVEFDHYSIIIHKNTTIPASMSRTYYTSVENQEAVAIEAFQGENPEASKNTFIGSFVMDKLPRKLPDGSPLEVTFEYNLNGNVEITAIERKSGRKEKMKVDVNRLEKAVAISGKEPTDDRPKKDGVDKKKIERILKTAYKKVDQIDNTEVLAKIKDIIDFLEKALPENGRKTKQKAEELAELIAEI
jgi:molecular chaperone DnaK